jgi:hypothetical protein
MIANLAGLRYDRVVSRRRRTARDSASLALAPPIHGNPGRGFVEWYTAPAANAALQMLIHRRRVGAQMIRKKGLSSGGGGAEALRLGLSRHVARLCSRHPLNCGLGNSFLMVAQPPPG